ncbi:MAG: hypothetical protein EBZ67_15485, partial [Chitinophagia bacterium]|nr:hypothetical protein [Chitinophagia bacterium]
MKSILMKILGLRPEMGIGFYLRDFWFRIILRSNADASWAVHFTSTLIEPKKIIRGKQVYPGDSQGRPTSAPKAHTGYTQVTSKILSNRARSHRG